MKKMKPGLLSITNCEWKSMDKATIAVILQHVHSLILENCDLGQEHLLSILRAEHHLKVLKVSDRGVKIDGEVLEAVSKLPSDINVYMFGQMITLIHKADSIKSLSIYNNGVNLEIDTEVAKAISRLPDHTEFDLYGNKITDNSACSIIIHKAASMKSLDIHNCMSNCGIQIDKQIVEAVSRLPDHTQLDLSGYQIRDKSSCITLIHKAATMKSLSICNCGIQIDTEISEAVSRLPDHTELDVSGNQVTDKSACVTLIHKAATMKSLNIHNCISNCDIQIDTKIAEAVSRLPDDIQLDLSGNQVTDNAACMALLHKAATMKSLNIHNCISNCGIKIDTKIAEAVSRLPDDIQLDLSGNELTKMDPRLLPGILQHIPEDKEVDMTGWKITVDVDIVKALSKMPQLKSLKGSFNTLTPEAAREFSMPQLQQLYLSKCDISDTVCVSLMIRLSKYCPLLEVLNLSINNLTSDEWCRHVPKQLRELYLYKCGICDAVCMSLMISLSEHCPLLEVLVLGYNKLTSDEWCHHVQMKQLRVLDLSGLYLSYITI